MCEGSYHNGSVSDSVLWNDHFIAFLLPLRRLVFHIGNGDGQLNRATLVPPICGYDLSGDVGPLQLKYDKALKPSDQHCII